MTRAIVLLCIVGCVVGCTPPPKPPDLTRYPTTAGSATRLPTPGERVLVWGGHPAARAMAADWMYGQNIRLADVSIVSGSEEDEPERESDALSTARDERIPYILFVETPVSQEGYSWSTGRGTVLGSIGGVSTSTGAGTAFSASVIVRCVEVSSGDLLAIGSAHYSEPSRSSQIALDDVLTKLTCQALATAWGFRLGGTRAISSTDMCEGKRVLGP